LEFKQTKYCERQNPWVDIMKNNSKEKGSAVKIDSILLKKVEELILKEENRLRFVNKKQFIDTAVHEFIKKIEAENGK